MLHPALRVLVHVLRSCLPGIPKDVRIRCLPPCHTGFRPHGLLTADHREKRHRQSKNACRLMLDLLFNIARYDLIKLNTIRRFIVRELSIHALLLPVHIYSQNRELGIGN